jgi:hypothetical protein
MPFALPRLEAFRNDLERAADDAGSIVLARGWRDQVDDYDVALRVRAAGL